MKRIGVFVVMVIAFGFALTVTVPKLVKMAKVRGMLPGGEVESLRVAEKWHQTPDEHPAGRDALWVRFGPGEIRTPGPHRINLPASRWAELEVGDPIEIVWVGSDPKPYSRDGIFASAGNFAFDLLFLALQVAVGLGALARLRR
ncbi:MAG: hypothetical protein M5U13_14245 [Thermoanaerobaculia bacterium]|nr:hypothetical protein [Thermoanaerobaculia bacterium]